MRSNWWWTVIAGAALLSGCRDEAPESAVRSPEPEGALSERAAGRLTPVAPGHLIDGDQLNVLREAGLAMPIDQVVDSLRAHPEIIPYGGVLGGTMGFYGERQIHLLDGSWIYASFDDGHIQGRGLFEYQVGDDGALAFKVLYSTLD